MASAVADDIEFGQGLYAASEIERFVALHLGRSAAPRSQAWLREVVDPARHARGRPDYSFADLISVFVVAELRLRDVPLQRIRQAKDVLERIVGIEQALALQGLFTDGEYVFADLGIEGQLTNLNLGGQEGCESVLALNLSRVVFDRGARMRDRPAKAWSPADGVCVDPGVQFGAPCVQGRRITTRALHALSQEGATAEELAFEFRLEPADVEQALAFERRLGEITLQ